MMVNLHAVYSVVIEGIAEISGYNVRQSYF